MPSVKGKRDAANSCSLQNAANICRWDAVREILNEPKPPKLLKYSGYFDSSIFCRAIKSDAPLDILRSLYNNAPQQLLKIDKSGRTPLHLACIYASDSTVEFFLNAEPKASALVDIDGNLPLHWAAYQNRNYSLMKSILSENEGAVNKRNADGKSPIECFFVKGEKTLQEIKKHCQTFLCILEESKICEPVYSLKSNFLLFLRCLVHGNIKEETEWLPVHEALKIHMIPSIFHIFLMETLQQDVEKEDVNGNLLIHLILEHRPEDTELIQTILKYHLRSASIPNSCGRYPITLALANGVDWESGLIQNMFESAPHTLRIQDTRSGLFPFMLASCGAKASLDGCFELLRLDPSVLMPKQDKNFLNEERA